MEWYFVLAIVVGSVALVFLIILIAYFSYINPSPTGKLSEKISIIKSGIVNCFVYSNESTKILIDSGTSAKKVSKALSNLGIKPESISHVFLTHSDPDHIGGLSLFSHAKIFFGEKAKIKNPEKYQFLDDGTIMEVDGIKLQAIATPGHRLGHTAFIIDEEFIFTGDALRLKKGVVEPFLTIISLDPEKQKRSIEMLSQLGNISILFTAHTGFTVNFDNAIEKWKK
ncbi:MAG: MBL fold metallo-hydrolase [Candidatus Heimdallarchaeaceae archaeon]